MSIDTQTAPVVAARPTVMQRVKNLSVTARARLAGMFAFLAVITVSTPSHAATGLLGGAETTLFTQLTTFLTNNLLPLVFTLAAVIIGAGLLIRYGRKAVSS